MPTPREMIAQIPEDNPHAAEIARLVAQPELPLLEEEGRLNVVPLPTYEQEPARPDDRSTEDIAVNRVVARELLETLATTRIKPRTLAFVWRFYVDDVTLIQLGEEFGVSPEVAGNMARRAIPTLKTIGAQRGYDERWVF